MPASNTLSAGGEGFNAASSRPTRLATAHFSLQVVTNIRYFSRLSKKRNAFFAAATAAGAAAGAAGATDSGVTMALPRSRRILYDVRNSNGDLTMDRAEVKPAGRLAAAFASGRFAITAETTPTATADPTPLVERLKPLKDVADAVNVTDGATAKPHLSSLALAGLMARAGIEPVLQFTTRDRNRIALQADLLGAAALGVPNVLCLTGDDPKRGEEPEAKPVHDLNSVALIALARKMRDEARLNSGREIAVAPRYLIGAADAPIDPAPGWKPDALAAKVAAGADFVQTQYCFDLGLLRRYLARLAEHGLPGRAKLLVGIGPLASARQARCPLPRPRRSSAVCSGPRKRTPWRKPC